MSSRRARTQAAATAALVLAGGAPVVVGAACSTTPPAPADPSATAAQRMDPASCRSCHATHVDQWAASAHASASDDPLFVAMNRRAQRETDGGVGDFCIRCHAPVARAMGATTDGLNLSTVPAAERGVTCYFCHAVDAVEGASDAPLHLATDGVVRGAIANPVATPAHGSAYSALHDRTVATSASLCGSCHDVQLASGLAIEQTFAEWKGSIYAAEGSLSTCGKCHLAGTQGLAANVVGAPTRTVHDHAMAGVDRFGGDAGAAATQSLLDPALRASLCVRSPGADGGTTTVTIALATAVLGHAFPSGAVHDRRAWVELVASASGVVVFESGLLPNDQTSVESLGDPNLWLFKETLFGPSQAPVLFLWEAVRVETASLPVAQAAADSAEAGAAPSVTRTYTVPAGTDAVRMRVRLSPVAPEVTASLVASGDLAPDYALAVPVYTLAGTELEWTAARGMSGACVP